MSDTRTQLEEERRIINAAKRHCDLPLEFQHWGPKNQNGDYAESILFDANGESLAYGLPDEIGELAVLASTALPLRNAQLEAAERMAGDLIRTAQKLRSSGDQAGEPVARHSLHHKAAGIEYAVEQMRAAIEEAGA